MKVSWKLFTIVLKAALLVVISALSAILAALNQFFGGDGCSFRGVAPGSTILMFEGSEENFKRLKNAYLLGEHTEVQGFEIDYIKDVSGGEEIFRPDFTVREVEKPPIVEKPEKSWLDKVGESVSRNLRRAAEELGNQLEKTNDKKRMR